MVASCAFHKRLGAFPSCLTGPGVEMDIRYVKEKSLGGELTQKDKKGKDKDKAKLGGYIKPSSKS